uniref:SEA domain-containing protein n=1 Tax=Branchiostoma floridae TaxID=7739 RepID=C3XQS1_BRAFL|eukprot:XP_002613638.1 hypothetical protein BRAFLDRAFT_127104 [Branchiostoma floridae]
MPAGQDTSDFTDVKFLLVFASPINFTEMMSTSLDMRQHLENVTKEMVFGSFSAEVAATVANIWPKEIEISFTVHKDVNRKDINMTAEAEEFYTNWTDGRVVLDIQGTGVPMKPPSVSYERGFWSICQQDCSTIIDMSAFFPCMFIPTDVNVTSQMQQDVADSFLASLRNALQSRGFQIPEKVIHAVQVGRDTIDFRIQRTMGYQNLTGLQSAIQEILSWDEEFTVGHNVDGQHVEYRAANPDDEFNNTVKFEISLEDVNGDDIDLNNIMASNFTLRDVLEQDIINFVSTTLGPSSVATLNLDNIWIQSNYCTFSISVPLDQVHAIEAEARRLVSNIGNFNINVGSLQATAVDYKSTRSCDFCPPVCAPRPETVVMFIAVVFLLYPNHPVRDTQACYTHTSCQWCVFEGAPHCGADCLLQETEYELSVSCPCLSEPIGSEQQLQDSFRDRVLQLLRERYGGWNSAKTINSVHITPPTITFSLKSSMQQRITPDVISLLSNMSIWNGITITDGFNQYEVMEPTAPTDLHVTVEFQNVDFTNLVTQHSVSAVHLLPQLKTTLGSIGVSQECVDTTKILGTQDTFLEFSMTRAWDSTVNLTVEVKKLMEASRNGEFVLNLKPSTMECTCPSPTEGTFALVYEGQATGLSTPDKLGLAVGLPIALAALAALGVLLLFYLKKKKGSYRPPTKYRRRTVSPVVESFETNIYSASIDDNLSHQFGKKGAQLNRFRDPDAVYGRLSYSPPPSTASSTLTSEMSLPGTPDNFY